MLNNKNTKFIHILNIVQFIVILILFFILFYGNKDKNKNEIENNNSIISGTKGTSNVPSNIIPIPTPTKVTPIMGTGASLTKINLSLLSQKNENIDCKTKDVDYTVNGNSMEPMIKNNSKVKVINDYYKCGGNITRGDIVIYDGYIGENSLIKRIRALPGDKISVDAKLGELKVNGEVLKNSKKEIYKFSIAEITFLKLYIKDGLLQKGAYFIFGDNTTNSIDSRKFGAVSVTGFSGKVKR